MWGIYKEHYFEGEASFEIMLSLFESGHSAAYCERSYSGLTYVIELSSKDQSTKKEGERKRNEEDESSAGKLISSSPSVS
jgi:hypothetical protein